jgi:hypothetical protein
MSKDVKLIVEAYTSIYTEGFIDPYDLMNNLVGAITAGSAMLGGASSPDSDSITERTISKIVQYIENGNLDKKILFKTLIRARRENGRALTSLITFGEHGSYNDAVKSAFIKHVLPIAKKVLSADIEELRDLEAAGDANDYLKNKVDNS